MTEDLAWWDAEFSGVLTWIWMIKTCSLSPHHHSGPLQGMPHISLFLLEKWPSELDRIFLWDGEMWFLVGQLSKSWWLWWGLEVLRIMASTKMELSHQPKHWRDISQKCTNLYTGIGMRKAWVFFSFFTCFYYSYPGQVSWKFCFSRFQIFLVKVILRYASLGVDCKLWSKTSMGQTTKSKMH